MMQRGLRVRALSALMGIALATALPAIAAADHLLLKDGTQVKLDFDSSLSSKTAQDGQTVRFHVDEPVMVDGRTVIAAGTPVIGHVVKVSKRKRYGINAKIQLAMNNIRMVNGKYAPLGFKTKGSDLSGRTAGAAAATIGGAVLLGPIGLIGGLFIPGKAVVCHPGDKMTVQVTADTRVHI